MLLVFYSASRLPESEQMARDLATVAEEYEGRFLAGLVDVDAQPAIAQAVQLQSVPFVFAVIDGRPQPLIQDLLPLDDLRTAINQVMQQLTTQGITGRHQPRQAAPAVVEEARTASRRSTRATRPPRTRWSATTSTVRSRSTRSCSTPTRPTPRPPPAWRWPRCCSAPRTSTSTRPARPPTRAPTTSPPRPWSPTSTCSAAASRTRSTGWSTLVRRTAGDDRNQAREHLLGLFAAVGNDDPRVLKGRQALANALF